MLNGGAFSRFACTMTVHLLLRVEPSSQESVELHVKVKEREEVEWH